MGPSDSDDDDDPSPGSGRLGVAAPQEFPMGNMLPDRPRAMQGLGELPRAVAMTLHPMPATLQVPSSRVRSLGLGTLTSVSTSTSAATSGVSTASASSAKQSLGAESSRQCAWQTDRSRNYQGNSKYVQGKGKGNKCKRKKDKCQLDAYALQQQARSLSSMMMPC
jgi:hypothetical protein